MDDLQKLYKTELAGIESQVLCHIYGCGKEKTCANSRANYRKTRFKEKGVIKLTLDW